jgi:predicted metalloprotease
MAYWDKISSRGNVEDRRSMTPLAIGGFGGLGIIGTLVVLAFNLLSGSGISSGSLNNILNQLQQTQSVQQTTQAGAFDNAADFEPFAATVLGSANDTWSAIFSQTGKTYTPPRLVLFRSATQSGCGIATSDVGPHYCPADQTVYLDETFFTELQQRFHAKGGDVAEAYVIAHEVGHHVQNQLGIMDKVDSQSRGSDANALSIKLELQADCFAGIWANSVQKEGVFEPGEVNEALDAAAAVGDDRIQQDTGGRINPETWTHGSAAQRTEWFNKGYTSGKPSDCNTFGS